MLWSTSAVPTILISSPDARSSIGDATDAHRATTFVLQPEAPYALRELVKIRYLGPTELRKVHRAKLTYPGARFLQDD